MVCALQAVLMLLRKTSFEAVLEGFDSDAPEKWSLKGKSLPYGKLQCAMESWRAEAAAQDKKNPASNGAELWRTQPFFKSLIEEIKRVDGCATTSAQNFQSIGSAATLSQC